jgi:2',3'-cyclic-nucleotide 2'-phosphodiesterase (5'-nucleotidase family)
VAGIDLIVGGHSHTLLPQGELHKGVLIAQAGEYAQALGRVDLSLDPATGRVLSATAKTLEVPADELEDRAVTAALAAAEDEVERVKAEPVGVLQTALELDHFAECGIGNLATDALRERMHGDAAIVSSGMFHQGLPAGEITLGQLNDACFSPANPAVTVVKGVQILQVLERGLDPAICELKHHAYRGTPIGIPQVSGLTIEFDPQAEVGSRVQQVLVQGQPLDPAVTYRLAHTDAETLPEVGYLVLEEGQEPQPEAPTILREVLEDAIRAHSPVPEPARGRWVMQARP